MEYVPPKHEDAANDSSPPCSCCFETAEVPGFRGIACRLSVTTSMRLRIAMDLANAPSLPNKLRPNVYVERSKWPSLV